MLAGWANAKSSLAQAEHSARLAETELISAQSSLSAEATELREAQEEQDRPKPKPKSRFAESQLGKWSAQAGGYTGSQPSRVESAQAKVDKAQRTVDKAQRNVERADRQVGSSRATVDQWLVAVGVVAAVSVLALVALWGPAGSGPGTWPGRGIGSLRSGRQKYRKARARLRLEANAVAVRCSDAPGPRSHINSCAARCFASVRIPCSPRARRERMVNRRTGRAGRNNLHGDKVRDLGRLQARIGVLVVVVAALRFAAVYLMVSTQQ